jgi:hypothetical protein
MAINYPTSLDTLTNPTSSDNLDTSGVLHDVQHSDLNDAVEALEAKVGVTNSTVTTSHEYLLQHAHVPGSSPTYAATQTIDMDGAPYQFITMTGNITLATTNRGSTTTVKTINVVLDPNGSNRSVDFATGIVVLGMSNPPATQTLLTGKKAVVTLISPGSNEADTIASYAASS